MHRWTLAFLLACSGPETETDPTDTGGDGEGDDTAEQTETDLPSGLNGTEPDAPVALPTFTALNYDGTERGPADLQGHPTVVWFYPFAQTYG